MGSYGALWKARLSMLRVGNCLMAAGGTLCGLLIAATVPDAGAVDAFGILDESTAARGGPASLAWATWVGAPLAAFMVTAFGNVLNDLADRKLDARAHPERALASGRLHPNEAKAFAGLLLALGLVEALMAGGMPLLAFAAANAALLGLYEWRLKRTGLGGNLLVALLVGSTFLFGAAATGRGPSEWGVAWLVAALATLANLGREVQKDVEDARHDAATRRTLPHRVGTGASLLLAFAAINVATVLSVPAFLASRKPLELGPLALDATGWWAPWVAFVAMADLVFLVAAPMAWVGPGRAQRLTKLAMALALVGFTLGPLAEL